MSGHGQAMEGAGQHSRRAAEVVGVGGGGGVGVGVGVGNGDVAGDVGHVKRAVGGV